MHSSLTFAQVKYNFDYISLKDGLPAGTGAEAIIQDSIGFIWFPVLWGIAKYDGYNIKQYKFFINNSDTVFNPEVHSLYIDNKNNLWAGADNQIAIYDREKDVFNSFYIFQDSIQAGIKASVYIIQEDKDGLIWLLTDYMGLFSFDKNSNSVKHFTHDVNNPNSLNSDTLSGLVIDHNGNLWVSTLTKGLCKFNPSENQFTRYSRQNSGLPSDSVHAMFMDEGGVIWIAFVKGYIAELNPDTEIFNLYPIKGEGVNSSAVLNNIFRDKNGIVWLGTFRDNLILFNKEKNEFKAVRNADTTGQNQAIVTTITFMQDKTGMMWISGYEVLSKYSENTQKFYNYSDDINFKNSLRDAVIFAITGDGFGNIWIGTSNGFFKYDVITQNYSHYLSDPNPNRDPKVRGGNTIWGLHYDHNGNLWAASPAALYMFDVDTDEFIIYKNDPADSNSILGAEYIYEDSKGDIWLGGGSSLDKFERNKNIFRHYKMTNVRSIYEDSRGDIWAASGATGLYKYDSLSDSFIEYYDEKNFKSFSIATEDNNNRFWVASFLSGINLFDRSTGESQKFNENHGLPSNFVNNLINDNTGMLWLTSRLGLSRFDPDRKYFKNFTEKDGINFIDYQTTTAYKSPDGKIYFGGRGGMVSFLPAPLNSFIPNIVLTDFKIDHISINPSEDSPLKENINIVKEIELRHNENSISFEFAALDFRSPERNQYAYMLEGFDNNWNYSGTERTANYTNLNPGRYVFRAKGSNDDGVWNEEGTSVNIIINPPWWKTWWFTTTWIFLALTAFGGTIRFISVQRLKRKLRELEQQQMLDKERARISKDMHDEVGSSLTRISLLSEIAKNKIGNVEEINRISDASRDVVNNMDEIVWAVNPKNDSLENLSAYALQYAQNYFEGSNITCRFDFPGNVPEIPLSSDIRHNIFLTIKESLNNILKHSGATEVTVTLKVNKKYFEFTISDNGNGFEINNCDRFSNGLSNMKKRIEGIGGDFKIQSVINAGTKIILRIPFRKEKFNTNV